MSFIIFIIIFAIVVIVALVVVFILFIVKGRKDAKQDKSLYEKGLISQEQYDSGFNQGVNKVVNDNYATFRKLSAEDRKALENSRKNK